MKTRMHAGIGTQCLIDLIEEQGNRAFVEQDGKTLSDAAAVLWLEGQLAQGKTIQTNCPTPRPDGGCPGHSSPELRPGQKEEKHELRLRPPSI